MADKDNEEQVGNSDEAHNNEEETTLPKPKKNTKGKSTKKSVPKIPFTGGGGTIYGSSSKAKLNTTSSTETEIISVGERLPKHIWFRYFRLAQGGNSTEDILYQDNEAAMLLQNNGRMSCGKGSKHIHIRYFFVTDKIKQKELKVVHCPTKEMIADYYTKPLQGGQFYKFRDLILGINTEDMDKYKMEYDKAIKSYGLTPTAAAVA